MAHYSIQHVPVAQRVTETGDIGTARHVVGFSIILNKVCSHGRTVNSMLLTVMRVQRNNQLSALFFFSQTDFSRP